MVINVYSVSNNGISLYFISDKEHKLILFRYPATTEFLRQAIQVLFFLLNTQYTLDIDCAISERCEIL